MTMYEYFVSTLVVFTMFSVAVAGVSNIITTSITYSGSQGEKAYAESLFESILTTTGTPGDWGADVGNATYPDFFGLAASYSSPYDLDSDKLLRLYDGNPLFVPYSDGDLSTDAVRMLGLRNGYDFRLRFLLPLRITPTLAFNAGDNTLDLQITVTDIYERPVPLVRFNVSYAIYYDKVDMFTGLNTTKSNNVKILYVSDASNETIVYNIMSLNYYAEADALGQHEFFTNLTSTLIDIGVEPDDAADAGENVAVIITVGRATLGGISVPFVATWSKSGVDVEIISGEPNAGYLVRRRGHKLVAIYDPASDTGQAIEEMIQRIEEKDKKGHPYKVETAAVSPHTTSVSVVHDKQFMNKYYIESYKGGNLKVFELPLIAYGAPLESIMTFKTKGNPDNPKLLIFDKVLVFIDPLLMISPPLGTSSGLEYGGTPEEGIPVIKLQRMVCVEGYSYVSEFWLWRR